jgi:1-acyl-sn-glycerol-3-phosphate acyltransferase
VIGQLYRIGLVLIAPITIAAALLHVVLGLLYAALLFPWIGRRWRDAAVITWSRLLLLIIGVRLESAGLPPQPSAPLPSPAMGTEAAKNLPSLARGRGAGGEGGGAEGTPALGSLLLINHTSWLDVFSIAAVVPARFVAKAEIGRWPVFGWLAIVVGTLFVERGRRHAVMRTNQAVAERLRSGQLIGIFPEGTTTDGSRLLPFHANLVQPAIDLGVPLQPVGVRFTQRGEYSRVAMFVGEMNLMQSLWRIVTAPHLAVELHWLPALEPPPANRHQAARAARAAIAQALLVPLEEHEQLTGEAGAASEPSDSEPDTRSAPAS